MVTALASELFNMKLVLEAELNGGGHRNWRDKRQDLTRPGRPDHQHVMAKKIIPFSITLADVLFASVRTFTAKV
jgi:hypothetical protein